MESHIPADKPGMTSIENTALSHSQYNISRPRIQRSSVLKKIAFRAQSSVFRSSAPCITNGAIGTGADDRHRHVVHPLGPAAEMAAAGLVEEGPAEGACGLSQPPTLLVSSSLRSLPWARDGVPVHVAGATLGRNGRPPSASLQELSGLAGGGGPAAQPVRPCLPYWTHIDGGTPTNRTYAVPDLASQLLCGLPLLTTLPPGQQRCGFPGWDFPAVDSVTSHPVQSSPPDTLNTTVCLTTDV